MEFLYGANDPYRKRLSIAALTQWLSENGIDPQEDCGGVPTVLSLLSRLNHGRYTADSSGLRGATFALATKDIKSFLWGDHKPHTWEALEATSEEETATEEQAKTPHAVAASEDGSPLPESGEAALKKRKSKRKNYDK